MTIGWPLSVCLRKTAFRWCAADGSTLNAGLIVFFYFQGIWTTIAKELYIL